VRAWPRLLAYRQRNGDLSLLVIFGHLVKAEDLTGDQSCTAGVSNEAG
jgi:hypothetical protein